MSAVYLLKDARCDRTARVDGTEEGRDVGQIEYLDIVVPWSIYEFLYIVHQPASRGRGRGKENQHMYNG